MTWYYDPHDGQIDVYDHEGTLVTSNIDVAGGWGDRGFPDEVLVVMRDNMEGDQPSAYNQALLADAATENIEQGTPP